MHQRKGKNILIYFFLLLLVGSINNINLSSLKFDDIKYINITGLEDHHNLSMLKEIKNLNLKNIFFIDEKKISDKIDSNSLVENYEIFKKYPSSINIDIEKTKFLARINNRGVAYLVGSNGKLSKNNSYNSNLPFIFGKPDIEDFLNFKKIIDQSDFVYDDIKNLFFFTSKRWDIELENDIIIKLSRDYIKESLKLAFKLLQNDNFKHIKIIDARVKNQIILND